jgi:hypothetical protein
MGWVQAVAVQVLQLLARFQIDSKPKITFIQPDHFHVQEGKIRASHNLCFWADHHIILFFSPCTNCEDKQTIFSLDIKAFYPSVTYGLVKRAIIFFSSLLGEKEKDKIKMRLKMIAFGMGNTLLTFVNK